MAEREGILGGVAETEIAGVPIGSAISGALVAGVADGIIAMIPVRAPGVAVRGIAAWAMIKWGPRIFGAKAAQTGGLFLAYDAMQELFDFRGLVSGFFKKARTAKTVGEEEIELIGTGGEKEEIELIGAGEEEELPPELLGLGEAVEEKKLVLVA